MHNLFYFKNKMAKQIKRKNKKYKILRASIHDCCLGVLPVIIVAARCYVYHHMVILFKYDI
jgi:hypothetical protein